MEHTIIKRAESQDIHELSLLIHEYRLNLGEESNLQEVEMFLKNRLTYKDSVIFVAYSLNKGFMEPVGFTQLFQIYNTYKLKRMWQVSDMFVTLHQRKREITEKLKERVDEFCRKTNAMKQFAPKIL